MKLELNQLVQDLKSVQSSVDKLIHIYGRDSVIEEDRKYASVEEEFAEYKRLKIKYEIQGLMVDLDQYELMLGGTD